MPNHTLSDTTGVTNRSPAPANRGSGGLFTAVFVFLLAAVLVVVYSLAVVFLKIIGRDK